MRFLYKKSLPAKAQRDQSGFVYLVCFEKSKEAQKMVFLLLHKDNLDVLKKGVYPLEDEDL